MPSDPDCPYHVRLHPDERCTCTPSVNAPIASEPTGVDVCDCGACTATREACRRAEQLANPLAELDAAIREAEFEAPRLGQVELRVAITGVRKAFDRLRGTGTES